MPRPPTLSSPYTPPVTPAELTRKIIHIDMDAFYASVEQRDEPALRGRPVVVGGSPTGRGVVAAASYEARRYGIHSAMPAARAVRLCPDAVFIRPRFDAYRRESRRIQAIFRGYTELVEPLSLDEAYLDVTRSERHNGSATLIARSIKAAIREETGLVASAGVSYNKFLAKQASDMDKPDGLYLITPEEGPDFVAALAVGRFHGIGRATEARMHELGIYTGADLARWDVAALQTHFGKRGPFFHAIARGVDERPVQPRRERKSIGSENTFARDLTATDEMLQALRPLAEEVLDNLRRRGLSAETWTLKVKYNDFRLVTRSHTAPRQRLDLDAIMQTLETLLARTDAGQIPVRLLGVTASALHEAGDEAEQLDFTW
ncbi:DNA polymerase IV [Ectothiorhodospiraceae bacterium WFHF3C12]|nr:DNA polymerase IV [Ectothiorhodospiraceae bacterium WFHF3C12]